MAFAEIQMKAFGIDEIIMQVFNQMRWNMRHIIALSIYVLSYT